MHEQTLKYTDESVNGLFRNKVRVIQPVRGYRVSEDALILTWFARPRPNELILDAGTGCGVIAFGLAAREPSVFVVGLEIQEAVADRARRGVHLNKLESSVGIVRGDVRCAHRLFRSLQFDAIVSNPPYHEPGRGRINLQEEKALSRHQLMMPLADLFRISKVVLKPNGRLCIIYPAGGVARIQDTLKEAGFKPARMLWIHPYEASGPCLLCVEATHESPGAAVTEEYLFMYHGPGKRTPAAEAILAGEETGDHA
jgi:tRNA1Val (adenine37-N6)-methyltransferase